MRRTQTIPVGVLIAGILGLILASLRATETNDTVPSHMSKPALAVNADGRMEAFAVASGELYHDYQTVGGWSGWQTLGSPLAGLDKGPVVGKNPDGTLEIFASDASGDLYHTWQDAGTVHWSAWTLMHDFVNLGGFDVDNDASGTLNVLVSGDYDLWQFRSGASGWTESNLGRPSISALLNGVVSIGHNTDGGLEVFAFAGLSRDSQTSIQHRWQTSSNAGWSNWTPLSRCHDHDMSSMSVESSKDGRLEVFSTSPTTSEFKADLCHARRDPEPVDRWNDFDSMGDGTLDSTIPIVSATNDDGRIEVFAMRNGGDILHTWQLKANGRWSGLTPLGRGFSGGIATERNRDGRLEILAFRSGKPYLAWQLSPGRNWSSWEELDAN